MIRLFVCGLCGVGAYMGIHAAHLSQNVLTYTVCGVAVVLAYVLTD